MTAFGVSSLLGAAGARGRRMLAGAPAAPQDDGSGLSPEVTQVAPALQRSRDDAGVDRRRAYALLRDAAAPLALDELQRRGIRRPGQAIYELQLAGYRIDRVAGGYAMWTGRRGGTEGRPTTSTSEVQAHPARTIDGTPGPSEDAGTERA